MTKKPVDIAQELMKLLVEESRKHNIPVSDALEDWVCRLFFMELESLLVSHYQGNTLNSFLAPSTTDDLDDITQWYLHHVHTLPPFADVLGNLFSQLRQQRFIAGVSTLNNAQDCFGASTTGPLPIKLYEQGQINLRETRKMYVCDPATHFGGSLLNYAAYLHQSTSSDRLSELCFILSDSDEICLQVAVIQLVTNVVIHNIQFGECVAYVGDSLNPTALVPVFASTLGLEIASYSLPTLSTERFEYINQAAIKWEQYGVEGFQAHTEFLSHNNYH